MGKTASIGRALVKLNRGRAASGVANPWTGKILAALARSVEAVLEVGRLLQEAKADLPHGEFLNMIERDLPFGPRSAQRYMAVAADRRYRNTTLLSHLPASVAVLYSLTKLPVPAFQRKILDGTIHPGMSARDAVAEAYYVRAAADEERVKGLRPIAGRFRTLVIDPPWESGPELPYASMSQEQLLDMPVAQWAYDDGVGTHLYLWTLNGEMRNAFALLDRWGFSAADILTWVKPNVTFGHHFRRAAEHVLFATNGRQRTRAAARSIRTFFEAPNGAHSEKPDAFYDIVRAASYPTYGEAFQREARPAFVNLYRPVGRSRAA